MDFGLGLVLSFTDNASSGIQNAVNSLNQLTETASNASSSLTGIAQLGAFSVVADQMGSSLLTAGKGVLGIFSNILGRVQQTGSEFENFRITLNALYGDTQEAERQISKLLDFSVKSPFEVDDVKDMLVVLKSQGIDAFKQMSSASSDFQQENLAWIADLMAFKPDIPVTRWKLGLTNFLGSGMPKVLENALDMGHIEDIIGHSIGTTAEERMNDLIEVVSSKNLQGLANNMSHTWQGVASNIDDAFTKLYMSIADNGVFEKLKGSFMGVAGAIMSLDNDEISALGKTIAEGLDIIVTPITIVADKVNTLITNIVRLCQTNPGLVKTGMVLVALAGTLLVFGGVALKFMSSLGMLTIGLTQFGSAFTSVSSLLRTGALKMLGTLLPLTATIGLIYLSWKNDFGGIRTLLTQFISNVRGAFNTARQALDMNVNDMMITVNNLQNTGDFWSNITVGLIKIGTLWQALSDAWNDYTLSEDLFLKCKELGILPLVEAILDLKYRMEHFVEGFKKGFDSVLTSVISFGKGLTENLKGTVFDTLIEKATSFFELLTNNDPEAWERLGEIVGELTAKLIIVWGALKVFNSIAGKIIAVVGIFSKLQGVVGGLSGIFGKLGGFLAKAFPNLQALFGKLGGLITRAFGSNLGVVDTLRVALVGVQDAIMTALTTLAGIVGAPVEAVVAVIIAILSSVIVYAVTHWEEFKAKMISIWTTVKDEASAIWNSLKEGFISIWENLKSAIEPLITKFGEFKDKLVEFGSWVVSTPVFQFLVGLLAEIGRVIVDTLVPAVQGILHIFSTVFQAVWGVVVNVFNAIVNIISSALGAVMDIISGVLSIIQGIFTLDLEMIWDGVCSIFGGIYDFISTTLSSILNVVGSILGGILDIFVSIWEAIFNTVKGFVDGIFDAVGEVLSGISSKAAEICGVVKSGFDTAIEFITGLPGKALEWGKDFIGGLVDGIKGAIGKVTDAVKGVADKIKSFLHFSVPDEGPLTDYESWMPDFMNGLAEGINSSSEVVTTAITTFTEQVKQSLNTDVMASFQTFSQQWGQQMQVIITSTQQMSTGVSTGMTVLVTASQKVGTGYAAVFKSILTITTTTVTGANNQFTKLTTTYTKSVTTMVQVSQTGFTSIASVTQTSFTLMATTIATSMQKAVQSVQSAVNTMRSTMNFQWSLPNLKVPHVNVSGSFNLEPPSAPKFSVDWYAKGGVFDEPNVIGVGEAGKEAVMPLENNTGWISELAFMISKQIMGVESRQFVPTDSAAVSNNTSTVSEDRYMTSNVTNNNTKTGDTDNSVNFAEGAIQINCQNASEEEALRMAKVIIEYIKRQKELDKMLAYG